MRTIKTKKTLLRFNRDETNRNAARKVARSRAEIRFRDDGSQEADERSSAKKTVDRSPEELTRIWKATSG